MPVFGAFFSVISQSEDCRHIKASQPKDLPLLPLGGGSNILFTKDVPFWVLKNEIKGIKIIKEDAAHIWVEVGAGEVWHDFVMHSVTQGWGGVENLALIPGTVGAAPIQNIGAYGAEVRQTIESVTCWHFDEEVFKTLTNAECAFGYRDSIFKHTLKGRVFVTHVVFKLSKQPVFNISYGNIKEQLSASGVQELSLAAISEAVIQIRRSKLPDPAVIGNAGSFFKNPEMPEAFFEQLRTAFPNVPSFPAPENKIKVPAAWLIENCGWKGFREGDYGVHEKQPLVLVNYGDAAGKDIFELSEKIIRSVQQKFGLTLEREVQII